MGKSEGMVIICPAGDHTLSNGQYLSNSSSLKWRCQKVSSKDPHACSVSRVAVMAQRHPTGWMLLHPTISSHALVKPGPGCGIILAGKSHTALGHGCFPLRQLFTASCLSHFASYHQFALDTCTSRTQHLTPCLGSPGSSCCHQWPPALARCGMYLQRSQVTAAVENVTGTFSALCKAKI